MHPHATDFCFAGAAVLPALLLYSGEPGLAVMAMAALMLAGAVCGIGDPEAPHRTVASPTLPGARRRNCRFIRTSRQTPSRPWPSAPSRCG